MRVNRDWWKVFFNGTYLITDARSVCDRKLTGREVDFLEDLLKPDKNGKILDLCGGHGRHSLELARRGYRKLTVLDFSDYLIRHGRKIAKEAGLRVHFIRADARFSGLKDDDYSVVFIMANSFGYLPSEKEDLKVLKESCRLLKEGGKLLLDLVDPDYVRNNIKPFSWHKAENETVVLRERRLENDVIKARELVISGRRGLIRDGRYSERIYDRDRITKMLDEAGFKVLSVKIKKALHKKKEDYGLLGSRMIVVASKDTQKEALRRRAKRQAGRQ